MYSCCFQRTRDAIRSSFPFRFSLSPLCLYLQSRLPRKRLLPLGERRLQQRKARDPLQTHLVLTFSPCADQFSHRTFSSLRRFHGEENPLCSYSSLVTLAFASGHRRTTSYDANVDYMFPLINIACALCANEDGAAFRDFSRKSARDLRRCTCTCAHTSTGSYVRSWPRQAHLSRERDSLRALPPLLVATRPASCSRQQPVSATAAAAASMR